MKNFVIYIVKVLGVIFCSAVLLEVIYAYAFTRGKDRNKIQQIVNSNAPKNYDVVILGSSRANNHFVSSIFQKKGLHVFNYGMSGSRLEESALLLQLLLYKKYKIKNIIVEVDLNINSEGHSEGTRAMYMPYLNSSNLISEYYSNLPEYSKWKYIPFYRFVYYDSKIGFREMFFSLINKKTKFLQNEGY